MNVGVVFGSPLLGALLALAACDRTDRARPEPTTECGTQPCCGDPPEPCGEWLQRQPANRDVQPRLIVNGQGCVADMPRLRESAHAGMSVAHNYAHGGAHGYGTATSRATLRELRDLGVRWVSLTPFGYQRSLNANRIRTVYDRPEAENDERLEREIRAAHELGLRVFLKPHVWIGRGEWRGDLAPSDPLRWFTSYSEFILHYAEMAKRMDVELFAVGCEVPTSTGSWPELLRSVRAAYHGQLTFAANWDALGDVPFWDALDYVGVQFYAPLAQELGTPESELRRTLERHLDELERVSHRLDRPVILTEVGYKSIRGTELRPHEWPERHGQPHVDQAAQAQAYRRLFTALSSRPRIVGVYIWKWFTDPNTNEEGADGFSVRGKTAEAVVRSGYSAECAP